jgi:hypothetical protein
MVRQWGLRLLYSMYSTKNQKNPHGALMSLGFSFDDFYGWLVRRSFVSRQI